jgi:hypothetical protein
MGLDVTAYRKLTPAPDAKMTDGYLDDDGVVQIYRQDQHFPGRCDEFADRGIYRYGDAEDCFSGGYMGYGLWREQLAALAGYPPITGDDPMLSRMPHSNSAWQAAGGPFWELINFSDCEGTIGTAVSAKLAQDFANFQTAADHHHDERFRRVYLGFRKAFETAADGGCVVFH